MSRILHGSFSEIPFLFPGSLLALLQKWYHCLRGSVVGREELGCFLSVVLLLATGSKTNWCHCAVQAIVLYVEGYQVGL